MNEQILDLLYRSLDSELAPQEQKQLDEALTQSEALRVEKKKLLAMRGAVGSSASGTFRPFFAERVMQRVKAESAENGLQEFFESMVVVFRRVALIGAVAAVALVAMNLSSADDLTIAAAFGMEEQAGLEQLIETPVEAILE
jgi:anti-sigma factor RsiW